MKKLLYVVISLIVMAGLFTSCGKEEKVMIQGVVTDKETGEVIPDVTLVLQGGALQVITRQDGTYAFDSVQAGTYILKAQKKGYNEYVKEEIQLTVGQTITLPIELEGEPFEPNEPELRKDYTETVFGVNLEMVYVPGGTFLMGATAEQGVDVDSVEKPVRRIQLNGYHIGKYEVTQAQWQAVMGMSVRDQQNKIGASWTLKGEGDNYPMYYVGWEDAQEFCKKLSEATGKKYVLPTEAQWEYAARGGNKRKGYKYAGSDDIDSVAWYRKNYKWYRKNYKKNGGNQTHEVGTKKANELGIYDMSGNVEEWCLDWFKKYDESNIDNLQEDVDETKCVIRGGSWCGRARLCQVSSRVYGNRGYRLGSLGFRVACIAE